MGGYDGDHRLKSVECYDPNKNQWMLKAPMNQVRSDSDAAVLEGSQVIPFFFKHLSHSLLGDIKLELYFLPYKFFLYFM